MSVVSEWDGEGDGFSEWEGKTEVCQSVKMAEWKEMIEYREMIK